MGDQNQPHIMHVTQIKHQKHNLCLNGHIKGCCWFTRNAEAFAFTPLKNAAIHKKTASSFKKKPFKMKDYTALDIKAEMEDITIFRDILFTFLAHFAIFFCTRFPIELNIVFIGNGFSLNKATLKVRVNDARRLWCF